jgi:hypothetical protein
MEASARVALAGRRAVKRRARLFAGGMLAAGLLARVAPVDAAPPADAASLFFVSKSENKNQVAYEVRIDASCRPVGEAPVFAYWRMLEQGATRTEPLLPLETPACGVARQEIAERSASGGTVRIALRALPDREILVRSSAGEEGCVATATTRIHGTRARLFNVHARISWPFGVASLLLTGWAESDGRLVRETMRLSDFPRGPGSW